MQTSAFVQRARLEIDRSPVVRYAVAVVAVLLAFLLRILTHWGTNETLAVYQTFYLATIFVAWQVGARPAYATVLIAAVIVLGMIATQIGIDTMPPVVFWVEFVLYFVVSALMIWVIGQQRSARLRAEYRRSAVEHMVDQLSRLRHEYERALRQVDRQSAYMETVLRQLPVGVVISSSDGSFSSINRRAEELLGRSPTQAEIAAGKYHRMVDLETGEAIPFNEYPLLRAMRGETPPEIQVKATRLDEQARYLRINATPIYDLKGNLIAAVSVFADIEPEIKLRQQLETALSEIEAVLRQLPVGVAVVSVDGKITSFNQRAEELLGSPVTPAEAETHSHYTMVDLTTRQPIPVENYPLMRALRGEIVPGVQVEVTKVAGDKHWLNISATPIYNTKGELFAAVKVIADIEPELRLRAQLETALEEQDRERRRLQTVLDILPIGVNIATPDGEIVYMNEGVYRVWGHDTPRPNNAEGYAQFKAWRADTGEALTPDTWALTRALKKGETTSYELLRIERFDGTRGTIINTAAPIRDADGDIIGAVASNTDVSELFQSQQALTESELRYRSLWNAGFDARIAHQFGVIVDVNDAYTRMLGYEREELINQDGTPILARPEDVATARRIAEEKSDRPYNVMLKRKDGSLIHVTARSVDVELPGGSLRLTTLRLNSEARGSLGAPP